MRDVVYIKLDAGTLRMTREENLPNLQPFDDESFHRVDKTLYGYRGSPRYWKDAVAEPEQDRQFSAHGSQKLHPIRARGRTSLKGRSARA